MAGPPTWSRVEELVHRIVGFYGAGLERVMGHVSALGGMNAQLTARLCEDELVSSLLLLHGLHPAPTVDRIQRALDEVKPYLGSHSGGVELLRIDGEGVVHLRLVGSCHGCPSSRATVETLLRRAVEEAAPESKGIEVEGVAAPSPRPGSERRRWITLEDPDLLSAGGRRAMELGGVPVLLLDLGYAKVAYRNACPGCQARLDAAKLDYPILICSGCESRFDVSRAGRAIESEGPHLDPMPMLREGSVTRMSLPGGGP